MAIMTKEARLEALYPKTQAETDEMIQLGMILKHGMSEVLRQDRITGTGLGFEGKRFENIYTTHFPMPDGTEWEMRVKRRET